MLFPYGLMIKSECRRLSNNSLSIWLQFSLYFIRFFDLSLETVICLFNFIEQGRLDGAICSFSQEEKLAYLKSAYDHGIRNLEMEGTAITSHCNSTGHRGDTFKCLNNLCYFLLILWYSDEFFLITNTKRGKVGS